MDSASLAIALSLVVVCFFSLSQASIVIPQYDPNTLTIRDTARCFSCMSEFYKAVWPSLSHVYNKPNNFTDYCDDDNLIIGKVPVVHCSTICISMYEEPNIGGLRIKGHIRGCMDDVLIHGFNRTIVNWYRWMHRDSCRPYRKKDLFQLPAEMTDDSTISVCTCYADHCNGNGAQSTNYNTVLALLLILYVISIR